MKAKDSNNNNNSNKNNNNNSNNVTEIVSPGATTLFNPNAFA